MKYTIYKVTNNMNGKIYIGCHKTKRLDDNYMGSGVAINAAYKKYGKENFVKELLHVFDNADDMVQKETALVTESFIQRQDTYNIRTGGLYGPYEGAKEYGYKGASTTRWLYDNDPEWKAAYEKKHIAGCKKFYRDGGKNGMQGKQHTKETRRAMSIAQSGEKSSQYGTCWIHNNKVSKKINKDDLNEYLTEGWIVGRKMKFK